MRTRRTARRSQRGAVLVEAALVLPVMILIVVGILEFGLLFTSYSTTTASTRSGARLAATNYAPAGAVVTAQRDALTQIALSTSADLKVLNNGVPIGMVVYKVSTSSTDGAPTGGFPGANMAGGCTSDCVRFAWNPANQRMEYASGTWATPDACGTTVDSIGVFVQSRHEFLTGFFGRTRLVNGHTVMRLEPLPTDQC